MSPAGTSFVEREAKGDSGEPIKLRIMKITNENGADKTLFIALSDSELRAFNQSDGTLEPIEKRILLTVDGHAPSAEDHRVATGAFNHNYGSTYQGRQ